MIIDIIIAFALTLVSAAEKPAPSADLNLAPLALVIPADVPVEWQDCGGINGYYFPRAKKIIMCNELKALPGLARFVYAHELGHAYIDKYDIPYTGLEEAAADELAAIALVATGNAEDIFTAAEYFNSKPETEEDVYDSHPSHARRVVVLACTYVQSQGVEAPGCYTDFWRTVNTWSRLMATYGKV